MFELKDFGTFSADSVDYPDMINPMAAEIMQGKFDFGIAICGTVIALVWWLINIVMFVLHYVGKTR